MKKKKRKAEMGEKNLGVPGKEGVQSVAKIEWLWPALLRQ